MTICDLCGKHVPTNVCAFGKIITEARPLPSWDLCDTCEKRILNRINWFIDGAHPELDDEDYLFNKKYNAD